METISLEKCVKVVLFISAHDLHEIIVDEVLISYTAAHHQEAVKMFSTHFGDYSQLKLCISSYFLHFHFPHLNSDATNSWSWPA